MRMNSFGNRFLIRPVLGRIGTVCDRLTERGRDALFLAGLWLLILEHFALQSGFLNPRHLYLFLPACLFFGLMILGGLTGDVRAGKPQTVLLLLWGGVALFMLLTAVLVNTDNFSNTVFWLFAYPVFFLAWNSRGSDRMQKLVLFGVQASFGFFLAVSALFFLPAASEYRSFFLNQNSTAAYALSVFALSLGAFWGAETVRLRARHLLFTALAGTVILYASSRASMLAALGIFLFSAAVHLTRCRKTELKRAFLRAASVVFLLVISIFTLIYPMQGIYRLAYSAVPALEERLIYEMKVRDVANYREGELSETLPQVRAEIAAGADLDEMYKELPVRYFADSSEYAGANIGMHIAENFSSETYAEEEDGAMNGRTAIWKAYLKCLGFLGVPEGTVARYDDGTPVGKRAHNTILQLAFESGAAAAVCFALLNLLSFLLAVRYAFVRNGRYAYLPLAMMGAFCILSLAEAVLSPVTRTAALLYLVEFAPLMRKEESAEGSA